VRFVISCARSQLQDFALAHISALTQITHLTLSACAHITAVGIHSITSALPNLMEFNVPLCHRVGDHALCSIGHHLAHSIRQLNLTMCTALTDAGLQFLANCSQLESVILISCASISDVGLVSLAELPQLRHLDISWCKKITSVGIESISSSPAQLTHLRVCGCAAIGAEGLDHLVRLTSLVHLNLYSCNVVDRTLSTCVSHMTHLQHLSLNGCSAITDAGMIGGLKPLQRVLQHLSLASCQNITDVSLAVIGGCLELRELDLSNCDKITSEGLKAIEPLWKLQQLDVSSCELVEESDFLDGLKDLQHLDVSYCPLVTDEFFGRIGRQLLQLRQLNAVWCSEITDSGLLCLKDLLDLRELQVQQCDRITRDGIACLRASLPSLMVEANEFS
jgi:F-box and leucine-rich repeat protein 14